ncbi:MAG: serine--tRNA ligase [Candidatus Vogelbacteria bacterium]|nr:serine--tRNA ligase [Candidatus Vogelbacteria bacterium]
MLDIKFIRENAELVREAAKKKRLEFDLDKLLALDGRRFELLKTVETERARQNEMGEKIAAASAEEKSKLIAEMTLVKGEFKKHEEALAAVMKEWRQLMLAVPNIPDISVPDGQDESGNVELAVWGKKPKFDFEPKDHLALMTALGMVDFERGVKVHGFRGYFLIGRGTELAWALLNYTREFFARKNFVAVVAPAIVKKEYFYGTGHLPREAEDLFKTQDDNYLSGTAEVPMMAYHADEILSAAELPKRYLAFSPCFRREAGSHGKDTKGLIRVHEFFKFEQLVLCRADHAESVIWHEEINRNYEEFLESLALPYRRVVICGGDLSLSKVKQYDTEIWFPSLGAYREGSSASYYHDFQTRRFNIRYRDDKGKLRFVHSLNSTASAIPRLLAAVVENCQQADGSLAVPEVLQPYLGGQAKIGYARPS